MTPAAQPGHPIRRLVLNDIGPFIPSVALRRLGRYIDAPARHFGSLAEAELHYRQTLETLVGIHAVYVSRAHRPLPLKLLIDFLAERFGGDIAPWDPLPTAPPKPRGAGRIAQR